MAGIAVKFSATDRLVFNEGELHRLLRGPSGPVARDLLRRAQKVRNAAVRYSTGPARPPPRSGGPGIRSGRYRASISVGTPRSDAIGLYVPVGSNVVYARPLEDRFGVLEKALSAAR